MHAVAEPVAGQPVCVRVEQETVTDADGRFVLRGLARRAQRLDVEASGHAPWSGHVDPTRTDGGPQEIRLGPGTDLEGRVSYRDGSPAANPRVYGSTGEGALFVARATRTDAEGRFRLPGFPPRGTVNVRSTVCVERAVELPSPPITLQAPPLGELQVRVVDAGTGLEVRAPGSVRVAGNSFSTLLHPRADGVYGGRELPVGPYELRAIVPGYVGAPVVHELRPGRPPRAVELPVRPGGVAFGRVADADGGAVAGVRVSDARSVADPLWARTDAAGAFELRGLAPGAELLFMSPAHAMQVAVLAATGSPGAPARLDVVLGEGATVRGRVRAPDGTPRVGVLVSASFADAARGFYPFVSTTSDGRGGFVLERVPVGPMVLAAGTVRVPFDSEHGLTLERDLELA